MDEAKRLIDSLTAAYQDVPVVEAVAIAGSRGSSGTVPDALSDIDLYVYTRGDLSADIRRRIMLDHGGISRADPNLQLEWRHAASGIGVDVIVFDAQWMEDTVLRVVEGHQAQSGYTTCFWHTVRQSIPCFDRAGWFSRLQQRCAVAYPDALRQAIIDHNHPMLRNAFPSYSQQIAKALERGDGVSVNHRVAALVAGYFDCLFAANGVTHPGEKRLVELAAQRCARIPERMAQDLESLFVATAMRPLNAAARRGVMAAIDQLLEGLDRVLVDSGLRLSGAPT